MPEGFGSGLLVQVSPFSALKEKLSFPLIFCLDMYFLSVIPIHISLYRYV